MGKQTPKVREAAMTHALALFIAGALAGRILLVASGIQWHRPPG
jgi:hypothetical protein